MGVDFFLRVIMHGFVNKKNWGNTPKRGLMNKEVNVILSEESGFPKMVRRVFEVKAAGYTNPETAEIIHRSEKLVEIYIHLSSVENV